MLESIYVVEKNGDIKEINEKSYEDEDDLQKLVERYPELLSGLARDQMNPDSRRRWLLISREMAVPDGSGQLYLDHLFVDQDGIPTLVEVKRRKDPRIHREVMGQMLDYAANGVTHWSAGEMQRKFNETCNSRGEEPGKAITRLIGPGNETIQNFFWETVENNLRSGKIRLVFLADQIPPALQRMVEFFSDRMQPDRLDVIAVELKQFVDEGIRTIVPRLVSKPATTTRTRTLSGITILDLLDSELLFADDKLEMKVGGKIYTSIVAANGDIIYEDRAHSLSSAGKEVREGKATNGWTAWCVYRNGTRTQLNDLRNTLIQQRCGLQEDQG